MKQWQEFTGFEWLLIDAASRYGFDKLTYAKRIEWSVSNILPVIRLAGNNYQMFREYVKPFIEQADTPSMFAGAVLAIWDTLNGRKSTWQVGADAASSGPQLLSCLLKCQTGMRNTGVLTTEVPDVYTKVTQQMNATGLAISRKVVKQGIVPHIYASEAAPKAVFGNHYPTFLKAYSAVLPKAQEASNFAVNAWNSHANYHQWIMPDGAIVHIPVICTRKKTIPCGKHSFEYIYEEIGNLKKGEQGTKALSANTTHSYDAYVLRELNRRCNYSKDLPSIYVQMLTASKQRLSSGFTPSTDKDEHEYIYVLEELFNRFLQPSIVAIEYLNIENMLHLSDRYFNTLLKLIEDVLKHPPFQVTNIHDEFKTLPNHVGRMKYHYNCILWETYVSNWWASTMQSLTGIDASIMYDRVNFELRAEVLNAPYSIG